MLWINTQKKGRKSQQFIRRIKDGTGIGGLVWNYATEAFV